MASVATTNLRKPTQQQPTVTTILVFLLAGSFPLLLPAVIAADPPTSTKDAVLAGLSSGACKDLPAAVDLRSCVDTTLRTVSPNATTPKANAGCCTELGRDCFCALLEKQGDLGVSMPPLACGAATAMGMCSRKLAGVAEQIRKELLTCINSDPTQENRKACKNQRDQIVRGMLGGRG